MPCPLRCQGPRKEHPAVKGSLTLQFRVLGIYTMRPVVSQVSQVNIH